MKQTLTTSQCVHQLLMDNDASWSYRGAKALIEHLENKESKEQEFCPANIQACWTEYTSALDCMKDCCDPSDIPTDDECEALRYLNAKTTVVMFRGGIVVAAWRRTMTKTIEELRAAAIKADQKARDATKESRDTWELWRAKTKADEKKFIPADTSAYNTVEALARLIQNDGWAATFQTMGQYRMALLDTIFKMKKVPEVSQKERR